MEKDNPGYVYAYGWNRLNMGAIGVWPDTDDNVIVKNRAWAYAAFLFFVIYVPQASSLAFLGDDLNEVIACLVINVPLGMAVFKIAFFRWRREVLVSMLSSMAKDWSIARSAEERRVMEEKAKYSRIISVMSVLLETALYLAFSTVRALAAKYERQMMTNETKISMGLPHPGYYPYDTKELKGYLPTLFCQWIATMFGIVGYSGPDSLMAMMILHLCGQSATLRIALANIVDEECINDPRVYWQRLSSLIERHEELNRYEESLEESFNLMLLLQMLLCTITFCFQGFMTFTTLIEGLASEEEFPVLEMAFLVINLFYTVLHLFAYCWAGDLLIEESTALSYAPYESDWFLLPPIQAKALMMVTNRSRIPLQITAGKFVSFSLELFTSIMKTSMAYLSVLLAVKED